MALSKARVGYSRKMARLVLKAALVTSAPVDVYCIAGKKGLQIDELTIDDKNWSGTFYRSQGIIAVNKNHHINRRRFTVAHELGHFCLEHDGQTLNDMIGFGGSFEKGVMGDDLDSPSIEREANEFASELLIPLSLIRSDYESSPLPKQLALKYQVSETAMFISLLIFNLLR